VAPPPPPSTHQPTVSVPVKNTNDNAKTADEEKAIRLAQIKANMLAKKTAKPTQPITDPAPITASQSTVVEPTPTVTPTHNDKTPTKTITLSQPTLTAPKQQTVQSQSSSTPITPKAAGETAKAGGNGNPSSTKPSLPPQTAEPKVDNTTKSTPTSLSLPKVVNTTAATKETTAPNVAAVPAKIAPVVHNTPVNSRDEPPASGVKAISAAQPPQPQPVVATKVTPAQPPTHPTQVPATVAKATQPSPDHTTTAITPKKLTSSLQPNVEPTKSQTKPQTKPKEAIAVTKPTTFSTTTPGKSGNQAIVPPVVSKEVVKTTVKATDTPASKPPITATNKPTHSTTPAVKTTPGGLNLKEANTSSTPRGAVKRPAPSQEVTTPVVDRINKVNTTSTDNEGCGKNSEEDIVNKHKKQKLNIVPPSATKSIVVASPIDINSPATHINHGEVEKGNQIVKLNPNEKVKLDQIGFVLTDETPPQTSMNDKYNYADLQKNFVIITSRYEDIANNMITDLSEIEKIQIEKEKIKNDIEEEMNKISFLISQFENV
jgi:hypothetical protein